MFLHTKKFAWDDNNLYFKAMSFNTNDTQKIFFEQSAVESFINKPV